MDSGEPNLPEKIYGHPAHEHELVLCHFQEAGRDLSSICDADGCGNHIYDGDTMYACENCPNTGCRFKMHGACAGIKAQMEAGELDSSESIHNPAAHKHGLVLGHFQGIGNSYCSLCESNIKKGDEIYTCETSCRFEYCHFSAHKACCSIKAKMDVVESNLAKRIYRHPAHYEHELVLGKYQQYIEKYAEHCSAYRCPNRHIITAWELIYECGHRWCSGCEFTMHSACAGIKDRMDAGEPDLSKRIRHPAHDHALVLRHHQAIGDSRCSFCENNYKEGDEVYTCETSYHFDYCRFSIHKACISAKAKVHMDVVTKPDLPERIYHHPAHEGELVLTPFQPTGNLPLGICRAGLCCNYIMEGDKVYACEGGPGGCNCKFKMHSDCAGIKMGQSTENKYQINDGELDSSERIHHPDHKHRLVLCHFQGNGDSCCTFCKDNFKEEDEIYSCETSSRFDYCHFSIHKSCSSINDVLPQADEKKKGKEERKSLRWKRHDREFQMQSDCVGVKAQMYAGRSNFPKKIYGHPAHQDELVQKTAVYPAECYAYRCFEPIRPRNNVYACENCSKHGCEFQMHRNCAGVKAQADVGEPDSSERIRHLAHDHALVLRHHQAIGESSCSSCGNNFKEGDEIYTCETSSRFDFCRFSIHKACTSIQPEVDAGEAHLPEMITYPDHDGALVLGLYRGCESDRQCSTCSVCKIKRHKKGEEIYVCGNSSHFDCDFNMDTACSSIKGQVHFRGHHKDHPLVFHERLSSGRQYECKSCEGELSNKLIFRCTSCTHSLHLLCGPLPTSIPYHFAGYDLNLILKDTFLDGVDPEDSWCDICEERRDPGKCVYRSEDPPFTAATDCLLPQIVRALKGHCGEVQLRTVKGHLPGVVRPFATRGSTEQEVAEQKRLLDEDTKELIEESEVANNNNAGTISIRELLTSLTQEEEGQLGTLHPEFPRGEQVIPFEFSDEAFELFKEHVAIEGRHASNFQYSWLDGDTELIKVGDELVASEFASLYRQLIEKHGAFTAESPLSQTGRAVVLTFFLMTIKAVLGLQTHQITGDLLCTLQYSWKHMPCDVAGFRLQFALDNLEKVARTCYALKLIEVRDGITMDLTEQIQQLVKEIEEDKPKAEALGVQYGRVKKGSAFGKQCPLKLSKLQWKNAGEFLGLDPEE